MVIKKKNEHEEERSPQIKIKTKIFRTVPTNNNASEETAPMVSTARRSNINVTFSCTECGAQVKKSELETCTDCGYSFCSRCLEEHECEDYDED